MTTRPVRIVFDNRPYLVVRDDGGSLERACGPFAPGTEPNMAECGPDKAVHSSATLDRVGAVAADQPRASSGARHARPIVRRAASGRAIKLCASAERSRLEVVETVPRSKRFGLWPSLRC